MEEHHCIGAISRRQGPKTGWHSIFLMMLHSLDLWSINRAADKIFSWFIFFMNFLIFLYITWPTGWVFKYTLQTISLSFSENLCRYFYCKSCNFCLHLRSVVKGHADPGEIRPGSWMCLFPCVSCLWSYPFPPVFHLFLQSLFGYLVS